jgi:hypothetical protein
MIPRQHQLGIGQFHGILHSVGDGECRRHHRSPAVALLPAGQDPEALIAARNSDPFAPEGQSFLDNLPAGFGANRSANDPHRAKRLMTVSFKPGRGRLPAPRFVWAAETTPAEPAGAVEAGAARAVYIDVPDGDQRSCQRSLMWE